MEETDRLFTCEFCRVKSYLVAKDVFRYLFSSQAPESKNLLYFPYWRFKGMLFSCAGNGVVHKFVDVSHQAVLSPLFPVSLGLRSQALKLKFVKRETAGRFLKPTQSFEQVELRGPFWQVFAQTCSAPGPYRRNPQPDLYSLLYATTSL
jgi:hypothetical protein